MIKSASDIRGMEVSRRSNATPTTTTTTTSRSTIFLPEASATLSEREQLKIEFYKTYDVMTGVRIAATLGGFFSLIILLLVYKSRCKSSKQLEDPRLTAAAAAAVAEAEAEERALAAALEAIARLPPRPDRGPRRSLCVEVSQQQHQQHQHQQQQKQQQLQMGAPRFSSVGGGGGYEALLRAPKRIISSQEEEHRRCSSVTCSQSTTGSSYLEKRAEAMPVPCLTLPPTLLPRNHQDPWDLYYPIDIQVIQPTPELSPCTSEAGLYVSRVGRAPLASMGSLDPPEPDSRSLGSDSVFLKNDEDCLDTEDEVSGFSTDSEVQAAGPSGGRYLLVACKGRRTSVERWDGCEGCVPRRRIPPGKSTGKLIRKPEEKPVEKPARKPMEKAMEKPTEKPVTGNPCHLCVTISATLDTNRCEGVSTSKSSSESSSLNSTPSSPIIELRHRPSPSNLPNSPPIWSQETLF